MKIVAWIVLAFVLLVILALGYYLLVGAILFKIAFAKKNPKSRAMRRDTEKRLKEYNVDLCWWEKVKFEKVSMQSGDGTTLSARFFDAGSEKTVIVVHGFGQSYQEMQPYCKFFYEKKFNVLAVDNRAHGDSEGAFVGFGWLDRFDILSWCTFLNEKKKDQKILLFGLSMGATAVCCCAGEQLPNNVCAIVSDCAFANAERQITFVLRKYKFISKVLQFHLASFAKRVHNFNIKDIDATGQVKHSQVPILFIHGGEDNYVPLENLSILYNATPENLRHKYVVEGAGHAKSYAVAGVLYEKKLIDFLKMYTTILL